MHPESKDKTRFRGTVLNDLGLIVWSREPCNPSTTRSARCFAARWPSASPSGPVLSVLASKNGLRLSRALILSSYVQLRCFITIICLAVAFPPFPADID